MPNWRDPDFNRPESIDAATLRKYRLQWDLTQIDLARLAMVSLRSIEDWESIKQRRQLSKMPANVWLFARIRHAVRRGDSAAALRSLIAKGE